MSWNYQREESKGFETRIPEGAHRVRIRTAEKKVSSTGNDMIVLELDVSGYAETLYHYIPFLVNNPQVTNGKLSQVYDSFKDIVEGDGDLSHWVGKTGACTVKHEDYNGSMKSKVGYFIRADRQTALPAWKEPERVTATPAPAPAIQTDADGFASIPDSVAAELPF